MSHKNPYPTTIFKGAIGFFLSVFLNSDIFPIDDEDSVIYEVVFIEK